MSGYVDPAAIASTGNYPPPGSLGSGTADATKFLRGDGAWAVPSGGSGGGPSQVKLTADLAVITSTTLTDTTGLSFSLTSGVYYYFKFGILFRSAATTTGIKIGATVPTFTRYGASISIPAAADGVGGMFQGWLTSSGDSVIGSGVQAINTDYLAIIDGMILPSANGALQIRHATEVSGSGITVRQGSFGQLFTL